jgi:hypothetical protein
MVSFAIISRSPLVFADFLKKDVSQMVQRFPELQRIDLGFARTVSLVQLVQVFASDQECGDPCAIVSEPDFA